ncbi:MAG: YgfZ/GcvT domain-containing protein [Microthrixaceae bacterium]
MTVSVDLSDHPVLSGVVGGQWPRDVLLVSGPDAVGYLQGQLSADVVTLEPGQSTLSLLLAPTGKLQAVLRLWRTDESVVVIDTDRGAGELVKERLERFLLRTDARVEPLQWSCIALRGSGSESVQVGGTGAELVGLGMWPGVDGVDLLGPSPDVPDGVQVVSGDQLEALRIRAGWPTHPAEVNEGVIPAEIGPWLITAGVSFTKGCYVGQELTARIDSRGNNVPRNLRCVESDPGQVASVGDDIVVRDDPTVVCGTVSSACLDPATGTFVSLGFVKRSAPPDADLVVRADLDHDPNRPHRGRYEH